MIFGVMADKDLDTIIDYLPVDAEYIFVSPGTPRAMKAKALEDKMVELGFRSFRKPEYNGRGIEFDSEGRIAVVLYQYRETMRDDDFVFIGGSTFVVAEVLESFEAGKSVGS